MKELFVSESDWDSHLPLLYVALSRTEGDVVELGCGHGSTMRIDMVCGLQKREFFSYETNQDWIDAVYGREDGDYDWYGYIKHVEDYLQLPLEDVGLLFIDNAPGEMRKDLIAKHANEAKVIVVHDSEIGSSYVYGLEPILSTFKYRKDYKPEGKPATTAVSNFVDVSQWQL